VAAREGRKGKKREFLLRSKEGKKRKGRGDKAERACPPTH